MHKNIARTAGLLYLIVAVTGFFSIIYVPAQTIVPGDAAATVSRIVASRALFQAGIVAGVICYVAFLLLPLALYRLLSPVGQTAAVLMVALAVVSVPIAFANLFHRLDVLSLLSGAAHLQALTTQQLHALVMLSLDAHRNGALIVEIFWGLWLLPFGYLVFRSGFLPRALGVLLMMGCFGYLINGVANALSPGHADTVLAGLISLPSALGEIGTCLWLLIIGVRRRGSGAVAAGGAA